MTDNKLAIRDDMNLTQLGEVFVKSGFFSDTRQASQAIVKVLAGRELGFGPIASMTGVYVIQGRISLSANLLAAAIKRTGKYNFIVLQMTDEVCEIEYRERIDGKFETIGKSKFTAADAKRAGTKNMDKYPRNMLYARAMSNGARWYCPDVFGGPVYTPEELGADVNEEGEVIDTLDFAEPTVTVYPPEEPAQDAPEPVSEPADNGNGHNGFMPLTDAEDVKNSKGVRYGDLETETLAAMANQIAKSAAKPDLSDAKAAEYDLKSQAIRAILASRNGK